MNENEELDQDLDIAGAFDESLEDVKDDLPENWEEESDTDLEDDAVKPVVQTEQPIKTQADIAQASANQRPWAGRFQTPEEMEQHLLQVERAPQPPSQQQQAAPQPGQDNIDDLAPEELVMLSEHDEADGTKNFEAYFHHKMSRRDLSAQETKALRDYDEVNGTDLYGDFREAKTERRLMNRLAPVLRPLAERQRTDARTAYQGREGSIEAGTVQEFGESFATLRKQSTDVDFIEKVLSASQLRQVIFDTQEKSPATAHRLLLREIKTYNEQSAEQVRSDKRKKSVHADVGGSARSKTTHSANSIEEAFDAALAEQG